MKKIILYIFCFCLISCSNTKPESFVEFIDGYWEIDQVILANGIKKEYSFNQNIDFFEIKDSIGVRKKVQPRLDGSFITTNSNEYFSISVENDSLRMFYKTALDSWKETVISAKENQLVIINDAGNMYFYRRYKKIKL